MTNLPYKVKVAVVDGTRIVHAPITGYATMWAELCTSKYNHGRQLLWIAGDRRLSPGCYLGDGTPVITRKDVPEGIEVVPSEKKRLALLKYDSDVGDFYLEIPSTKKLIYGGFSRFSAQRWAYENGYQVKQTV